MQIQDAIKQVVDNVDLTTAQAEAVLEQIMTGECTEAQIAALLTALRMKGETVGELTGFARVMRRKSAAVRPRPAAAAEIGGTGRDALIDTCGTGGDVSGTFNVSTATALVVAGAGIRVAKHGNRSASSQCGSVDVAEALGVRIDLSPQLLARCIDEVGIGFLPAAVLHRSMKYVAGARKQIGIRTIFNALGPITNPAGAESQLIGVYSLHLTQLLAEVLRTLGTQTAMLVHGGDGMDEITITDATHVTELRDGEIRNYSITPEEFGFERALLSDIRGGSAVENAQLILDVLDGRPGPRLDIVLFNAGAALRCVSAVQTIEDGIAEARESVVSGRAKGVLKNLIEFTNAHS